MKTTIIDANYRRDLYVFECEDGETGYFELLEGTDMEIGDCLSGNLNQIGSAVVFCGNLKKRIFVEDFCDIKTAKERIQ